MQDIESRSLQFQSKDGTQLFGQFGIPAHSHASALIVHGYGDHSGRYREVADTLHEAGFHTFRFDMRGEGRSHGARGTISHFEEYLEDLEAALACLTRECEGKNVLLVAHSNGALAGLRLMADPFRRPDSVKAMVLSSPFLKVKVHAPAKKLFAKVASRLLPRITLPTEIRAEQLSSDPQKLQEHGRDPLIHDVASVRWFTEALVTQKWVEEFADRVAIPSLWLVGGADPLADPAQSRKIQARLQSPSQYHEFPYMLHEVFNELERATVFSLLTRFCQDQFPTPENFR